MSHGFRYKSQLDALLHQAIENVENDMTSQIAIESARGAIAAFKNGGVSGPYLIRVPEDLKSSEEEILKELRPDGAGAIEVYNGKGVQVLALDVTGQEKLPTNHV